MTQEEKQLLLKDLCTRLPYGVRVKELEPIKELELYLTSIYHDTVQVETVTGGRMACSIEAIKPYLRPISSMTESEIDKLFDILHIDKDGNDDDWIKINDVVGIKFFFPTGKWVENVAEAYDYLNSIHIDYRGLIPMGLALEAPEEMYKNK